ncbi:cysteine--tRNA ligase [Roseivivax sp. GX 12232]|uniref:cysteine--tRNA ligase n=1 Tax=Roseivivax sp. GX 12232 TaxID=2900547 RepID=UPI001E5464E6|nr:cysteine--tRNA ligase [Roseivivax sp. GX 12232]MCE0504606.1 cysteine--tRNA ligase [Roseivivax sp. GX 12232]
MDLTFHNTRTRTKEPFVPIDPKNVRMYVCGPTVYDRAHLGNARPVVVFDVLYRLLRHVYGAEHVTYVRNFTDVDDKINARAQESGREIGAITEETIGWYLEDMGALGALEPGHAPRATGYIAEMVAMIEDLIAKGHAYEAEGHVLFAVESYAQYGKLSGRSVDDMIAGARVEVAPYKKNPMDFVLWKPSEEGLPGWDSPWGRGRPGWHIECSAMAGALLGESFDIHGGGNDLMFPHHENEIAQSACAHPEGHFANVWLHNEMLQVEGKKMSKSLGNFFTVRDLLDEGIPGEVVRFVLLSAHYRKPMDWTAQKRREAEATLRDWFAKVADVDSDAQGAWAVLPYLSNDLDTWGALDQMRHLASDKNRWPELRYAMEMMGFLEPAGEIPKEFRQAEESKSDGHHRVRVSWSGEIGEDTADALMKIGFELSHARERAMQTKDFSEVDRLKAQLKEAGVEVRMSKAGVELLPGAEFDAGKLSEVGS